MLFEGMTSFFYRISLCDFCVTLDIYNLPRYSIKRDETLEAL